MLDKNVFTEKMNILFLNKTQQVVNAESAQRIERLDNHFPDSAHTTIDGVALMPTVNEEGSSCVYNLGFTQLFSKTEYFLHLLAQFGPFGECYFTEEEIDAVLSEHSPIVNHFLGKPTYKELLMFNWGLQFGNTLENREAIAHKVNKQSADEQEARLILEEPNSYSLFQSAGADVVDSAVVCEVKL